MTSENKQQIDLFISLLGEQYSPNNYVQYCITETKELIRYGEYDIALDMLLDNLLEENIYIDHHIKALLLDIKEENIPYLLSLL